jgi:hypothetical protein
MKPRYENVVIFSSSVVTGGTEALHQLAFSINNLGGNAKIAYFDGEAICNIVNNKTIICSNHPKISLVAYEKYKPAIFDKLDVTNQTLLICPEILTSFVIGCNLPAVAIWWLSVDNAVIHNPNLKYDSYKQKLFDKEGLINFYQSEYAKLFLIENNAEIVIPLFDYLNPAFVEHNSRPADTKKFISIFPKKGKELADIFLSKANELNFKLIQNMSPDEVALALKESIIYIDFGHHPGKDRVPRESISSDAIIFVNKQGAASNYSDYPLEDYFKFSLDDIQSGFLLEKIHVALKNPSEYLSRQTYFKQKVALEKLEFEHQVKSFFFNN